MNQNNVPIRGEGSRALSELLTSAGAMASSASEHPQISATIIPVLPLGIHSGVWRSNFQLSGTITGTGKTLVFTVPATQFWEVYALSGLKEDGSFTVDEFMVRAGAAEQQVQDVRVDIFTATSDEHIWDMSKVVTPFPMPPNAEFRINVASYVGDGQYRVRWYYRRIDLNNPA